MSETNENFDYEATASAIKPYTRTDRERLERVHAHIKRAIDLTQPIDRALAEMLKALDAHESTQTIIGRNLGRLKKELYLALKEAGNEVGS